MAALVRGLRRMVLAPQLRRAVPALMYSTKPNESTIPTDQEQATGLEKKELEARFAGIEDPFNMKVHDLPPGTKDKPTLVPSMFEERIVGCIYDEDATSIQWMVLKKGPPQRDENGNWFQLVPGNSTKIQH